MYIEHIHIENFRGIEKIDLDLKSGVNILIGDNGTGKTTILEAMANALGGYLQGIQNLKVSGFKQDDFRQSIMKLGGASNSIKYHSPLIGFDLNIDGKTFHGERSRGDRRSIHTVLAFDLQASGSEVEQQPDVHARGFQVAHKLRLMDGKQV